MEPPDLRQELQRLQDAIIAHQDQKLQSITARLERVEQLQRECLDTVAAGSITPVEAFSPTAPFQELSRDSSDSAAASAISSLRSTISTLRKNSELRLARKTTGLSRAGSQYLSPGPADEEEEAAEQEEEEDYAVHVGQHTFKPEVKPSRLLHPEGQLRVAWDALMLALLTYIAAIVPLEVGGFELHVSDAQRGWDVLVDVLFMVDIALNFRTGYHDRAKILVLEPRAVGRRYLSTWFPLDLVSSFPVQMMLLAPDLYAHLRLEPTPRLAPSSAGAAARAARGARTARAPCPLPPRPPCPLLTRPGRRVGTAAPTTMALSWCSSCLRAPSTPALSTPPHAPPWTIWKLGACLRTPERRRRILEAGRGLGSAPQAALKMRVSPLSTRRCSSCCGCSSSAASRVSLASDARAARPPRTHPSSSSTSTTSSSTSTSSTYTTTSITTSSSTTTSSSSSSIPRLARTHQASSARTAVPFCPPRR